MTSREIVNRCLNFKSPERAPWTMWLLSWQIYTCRKVLKSSNQNIPAFLFTRDFYKSSSLVKDCYEVGLYIKEWNGIQAVAKK